MQKELIFGKRILSILCFKKESSVVAKYFIDIILELEKEFKKLMDECEIPSQVIINFRNNGKDIEGIYKVQSRIVSKYLIVIEIYTDKWIGMKRRDLNKLSVKIDLINTFAHELIHHEYPKEKNTIKRTDSFIRELITSKKLK